jgi:peptidoglycan/LPS O-acetylase OafA/YrhL
MKRFSEKHSACLDLIRGCAAVAVFMGHLRAAVFVGSAEIIKISLPAKLFYFFTGLGHQAVLVFFVLSGYFVGGSIAASHQKGRWSAVNYTISRASRIWIVLIPSLLLTLLLDLLGRAITNGAGYDGGYERVMNSGPTSSNPLDLSFLTFFGNVFALQTIWAPVFGSNGPLWSLANESWYYVLFPLLFIIFRGAYGPAARIGCGAALCALLLFLPRHILEPGFIWLAGYFCWRALQNKNIYHFFSTSIVRLFAVGLFMAALLYSKQFNTGGDWAVGVGAGILVLSFASAELSGWMEWVAVKLADVSYSLYLLHFSFIVFIAFVFLRGNRFQPATSSFILYLGLLSITFFYCIALWWLFERNTAKLRRILLAMRWQTFLRPSQATSKAQ